MGTAAKEMGEVQAERNNTILLKGQSRSKKKKVIKEVSGNLTKPNI